jgi:hypothetical protein
MKCIITKIETKNKWKDIPVCSEMVAEAKKLMEKFPNLTRREALEKLRVEWDRQFKQKALDYAKEKLKLKSEEKFKS